MIFTHKKKGQMIGFIISTYMTMRTQSVIIDVLPSFLMDSNVSLNWKQQKGKELGHAP
jgi:hypothetical protein